MEGLLSRKEKMKEPENETPCCRRELFKENLVRIDLQRGNSRAKLRQGCCTFHVISV